MRGAAGRCGRGGAMSGYLPLAIAAFLAWVVIVVLYACYGPCPRRARRAREEEHRAVAPPPESPVAMPRRRRLPSTEEVQRDVAQRRDDPDNPPDSASRSA